MQPRCTQIILQPEKRVPPYETLVVALLVVINGSQVQ